MFILKRLYSPVAGLNIFMNNILECIYFEGAYSGYRIRYSNTLAVASFTNYGMQNTVALMEKYCKS